MNFCKEKCCILKIKEYDKDKSGKIKFRNKKAGAFIYDPKKNKVLLVQSRGLYWGPPKGTIEENETIIDCAIREVKEETGIELNETLLKNFSKIKKATYYYIEMDETDVHIQENKHGEINDANGITWIKLDCLKQMVKDKVMVLNKHTRLLCEIYFRLIL